MREGDGLLQLLGDEFVELRRCARRRLDPDREQALLDLGELQDTRGFLIEPVDDGARSLCRREQCAPRIIAKARPGQLNFTSAGTGSATHFGGEMFKHSAGIDIVHVPHKGIPEALTDIMAGRVQIFMSPFGSTAGLIRDGKLRALAVTVGIFFFTGWIGELWGKFFDGASLFDLRGLGAIGGAVVGVA